jgi:hypothetical protein
MVAGRTYRIVGKRTEVNNVRGFRLHFVNIFVYAPMYDPAASSGVSASLLGRHSVLDTESSRIFWIPAFAGMTNSRQAAGNTTPRDLSQKE